MTLFGAVASIKGENNLRYLNDYDAIFSGLKSVDIDGWVSIEDGVDGIEPMDRSVTFLRRKIAQHWPT